MNRGEFEKTAHNIQCKNCKRKALYSEVREILCDVCGYHQFWIEDTIEEKALEKASRFPPGFAEEVKKFEKIWKEGMRE